MFGNAGSRDLYASVHEATVAVLMPDEAHRYESTVYSDDWLRSKGLLLDSLAGQPVRVGTPLEAAQAELWACMDWNRQTYAQVMGSPFQPEAS